MKSLQKYFVFGLFMTAGLIFAGCGETASDSGTDSTESATPADSGDGEGSADKADNASTTPSGDFQLVSLNVPNMTWGGCARSVRDALASVDGIEEKSIKTDTGDKVVSFKAKKGLDLDSALAAHADNSHLKDWSVADN